MTEDFEMAIKYKGKLYISVPTTSATRCRELCCFYGEDFCKYHCKFKGDDALCNVGISDKHGFFKEVKL